MRWMRWSVVLLALSFASALSAHLSAQTSRPSTTRATNVRTGALVSIDTETATLTLKPRTGPETVYRYTEKTLMLRAKKPVDITAFKAGDTVILRFRKSSVGPPSLYDLVDDASWAWLSRVRRETTLVTIREITEDELRAVEGPDSTEIAYRITEKTLWGKSGAAASAADFQPGERVHVVPRLLPSGGIMALAVSDATEGAARLKERTRRTVNGTVKAFDAARKILSLRTAAGEDRELVVAPNCLVRREAKDVPLSAVRPGQSVTAHLKRNDVGEQEVVRITIQAAKRALRERTPPRNRPSSPRQGDR